MVATTHGLVRTLDCRPTASGRHYGRAGGPALLTLDLLGALIMFGAVLLVGAGPSLASSVTPPPIIRIPADYPLPDPGARVIVPVPAGGHIHFDLKAFDPADAQVSLEGADLVLRMENGGELILEGFFASDDPQAAIVIGDMPAISAGVFLTQLVVQDDPVSTLETAAGGPLAAGGGEFFGLVQVVSWLLDRLDPVSDSLAAEPQQLVQSGDLGRFAQMKAQLRIAREAELVRLAARYESITSIIVEQNAVAALKLSDRAVIMDTGEVVFDGSAQAVLNDEDLLHRYLAI